MAASKTKTKTRTKSTKSTNVSKSKPKSKPAVGRRPVSKAAPKRRTNAARHGLDNRGRLQLNWLRNRTTMVVFVALFALIGIVTLLLTRAAVPGRPSGKLVPTSGLYLGAFSTAGGGWPGDAAFEEYYTSREAKLGRKFDIDQHFYSWDNTFGGGLEKWDVANGRVPLATWKPATNGNQKITAILSGSEDSKIAHQADLVKQLGKPLFIRFGHEMNLDSSPWNAKFISDSGTHNGTTKFIQAWRRVHDIFVAHGATNAVWVWEPGASDVPDESWNHWTNYYPGDSYVDWVGIDGYNWGTTRDYGGWISFKDRFSGGVYAQYSPTKPIMICETASTEYGGDKAQWIRDMHVSLKTDFPAVAAVVWFDENKETDWRFDSSVNSFNAFRDMAADSYFHPGFSTTSPPPPPPAPAPAPAPTPAPPPPSIGQPDLAVLDVNASPNNPAPGEAVTFSATIKNQGTLATPSGTISGVAFSVNGQKVTWSDTHTTSIAPGESVTLTANSGPTGSKTWSGSVGTYSIEAYVDDINRIAESNETNNKRTETRTIAYGTGWKGSYYKDTTLSALGLSRTDSTIDFAWGTGSPASGIATNYFSVRWTADIYIPTTGTYTFTGRTDDGVRIWVNNQRIASDWTNHPVKDTTGQISLIGGRKYPITVEYYENVSGAEARLFWAGPNFTKKVIPAASVYPR